MSSFDFRIDGPDQAPTLVFLHGWPDGPDLWDRQVEELSKIYRCVRITLPNFGRRRSRKGLEFQELLMELSKTVSIAMKNQMDPTVILVGHDWGAYLSYLYERKFPEQVRQLIVLDVRAQIQANRLRDTLFGMVYQSWLISAWLIGKVWPALGNKMSQGLAFLARAPHPEKTSFEMNYLYYQFWKNIFLKSSNRTLLQDYQPHCPTLFLYGKDKPVMFHSKKWEETLRQQKNSHVVGLEGAGHWMMRSQPEKTNQLIRDWLNHQTLVSH